MTGAALTSTANHGPEQARRGAFRIRYANPHLHSLSEGVMPAGEPAG